MDPERWQRVKQVFDGALACESGAQSQYIAEACQGDPEIRNEVENLLDHHRQASAEFLNQASMIPAETSSIAQTDLPFSRVGRRVGVYQILEEIGHGGMGQVFRAARVDGLYEKQVAIKFVRGGFDTASVLERFRNERQILATLDHSNIARLLDGGTSDDGIPYLVMELIEGTPIDEYSRRHSLGIPDKLKLFRQVCAAVQFAHQHLVIHRDIKPSNILVTADGTPKLLDFGIAKILDPLAGSEPTQLRPMTPEYASPEQVRGDAITTATDIYSLGVVLYQVLTGESPYELKTHSSHELAQAICEKEPRKPSSIVLAPEPDGEPATQEAGRLRGQSPSKLRRRLAGDLDNILLKALRKEPQSRYGSVEQFSDDIRRHLEGLPVTAARGSWSYRARKFATRHKAGVAAGLAVILSLALGFTLTLREKRIAERRFNDTRKLANSLIFEIDAAVGDLPGATAARKLLVSRALEYLDGLSKDAKGDASLERELATAYDKVGDVLGYPYAANLGDAPGALQSYRKALAIREALASNTRRADWKLQNELVGSYYRIANVLENTTDLKGALGAWQKALPVAEKIASGAPSPSASDQLAGIYYFSGAVLARLGDRERALASYEQGRSIRAAAIKTYGPNVTLRNHLAADYMGIASVIAKQGRLDEAIDMEKQAAETIEGFSKEHPDSAAFKEYLAESYSQLSGMQDAKADYLASFESARRAHQIFAALFAADANNHLAKANFAFSDMSMARALSALQRPKEALPLLQEAEKTFEDMSPEKSSDRLVRSGLAYAYSKIGDATMAVAQTGHPAHWNLAEVREARSWYEKSLTVWAQKQKLNEVMDDESGDPQLVAAAKVRAEDVLAGRLSPKKP